MSSDPKTHLKELADRGRLDPVTYSVERVGGPDHEPDFKATARLPDGREEAGTGRSKIEAEQNAAAALLHRHRLPKKR